MRCINLTIRVVKTRFDGVLLKPSIYSADLDRRLIKACKGLVSSSFDRADFEARIIKELQHYNITFIYSESSKLFHDI